FRSCPNDADESVQIERSRDDRIATQREIARGLWMRGQDQDRAVERSTETPHEERVRGAVVDGAERIRDDEAEVAVRRGDPGVVERRDLVACGAEHIREELPGRPVPLDDRDSL